MRRACPSCFILCATVNKPGRADQSRFARGRQRGFPSAGRSDFTFISRALSIPWLKDARLRSSAVVHPGMAYHSTPSPGCQDCRFASMEISLGRLSPALPRWILQPYLTLDRMERIRCRGCHSVPLHPINPGCASSECNGFLLVLIREWRHRQRGMPLLK